MGYVYLLGDNSKDRIYKIGVTSGKIENRIKKLQTGNSGEIYMCNYHETSNPFLIERKLHEKYCGSRVMNEWFELDDEKALHFTKDCEKLEEVIASLRDNPFFKT